jgi:hypothetical protein
MYAKVIGRTDDTFVHSHFELLYKVSCCFRKIEIYVDLEMGIRKTKILAYKMLNNNPEGTYYQNAS